MERSVCRICGWPHPKYEPDGIIFTIGDLCLCCGSHFELDDKDLEDVRDRRQYWLKAGANWAIPKYRPDDWTLEEQLANIPEDWR